jgi:hypothetical protein
MERGYLHSVVWIVLVALLVLLAMSWLPTLKVGDWQMRRVDLLSDLRSDSLVADEVLEVLPENEAEESSLAQAGRIRVDSCRSGMTCIDDMADDEDRGMSAFYQALEGIDTLGRPVRIAVLGDSYIEGDILTANLRQLLQERYGGSGVGFVPMTSDSPGFRRSVKQRFNKGWKAHNANDNSGYDRRWANFTGHYYFADNGAMMSLDGVKSYLSRLDTCKQSTFYCMGNGTGRVTATINGTQSQSFELNPGGHVQAVTVTGQIGRVEWRVDHAGGITYLGASLDDDHGVQVDNFALRAASGQHLRTIAEQMILDFDRVRHYDLVIVMYGLNVAGKLSSDYTTYRERMVEAIDHMKRNMPGTGFLVVSVGDREQKRGDKYRTMRGVISMVNAQQRIAYDARVAFWNLFTAMGGEGSIVRMVEQHQANLDYTHINFGGGARLGKLMFDAITWGHEQYHEQVQKGGTP